MRNWLFGFICLGLICCDFGSLASGQGLLVDVRSEHRFRLPRPIPRPPRRPAPQSYRISELDVNVTLKDQVAKVQVAQEFHNTGSRAMEVCFVFPLPYDGAVDRMTFLVDGKEYEAKLLDAKSARSIYEGYVRRNQDPALLEWIGTGMFKTSVFPVPAGAKRRVTMRYTQLCRKTGGLTEVMFPLSTARYTSKAVEKINLRVNIASEVAVKNVYSPTHSVDIKRNGKKRATVTFKAKNQIPTSDFRLLYDVGKSKVEAKVLSYRPNDKEDGYFVLLASPEITADKKDITRKTVVFVVDKSGSMSGKKIEQAREALKFVLNNLNEGDLFNIITYDSTVESYKPELQRFNNETRDDAIGFAEGIYAGGSTNIEGALKTALEQLKDNKQPSFVVFLTDGLPTAGVTNESKIVQSARQQNAVRARIFSFGVGYDVNSRLLDRISNECFGQSNYVRPNEDIEAHVSKLYNRIGAPAMTDVDLAIDVEGNSRTINRAYPRKVYDIFEGDQLVVVGRYRTPGKAKVTISGKVGKNKETMHLPASLTSKSADQSLAFVEKLWAVRRVGEIIDEIDLNGQNKELVEEMVRLSKKHGIITPYTSYLADDMAAGQSLSFNSQIETTRRRLSRGLQSAGGRAGFSQRSAKAALKSFSAPATGTLVPASRGGGLEDAVGGGGFGGGGGGLALQAFRNEKDEVVRVNTVRSIENKTFYYRKKRWVESTVSDKELAAATKIKRYSEEYFDLINQHGKKIVKFLALEDDLVFMVEGKTYALTK